MRRARLFSISFISLVLASTVLMVAPVKAQSDRLVGWVGRPGTQWSSTLTVNPGETINLYVKYTNTSTTAVQKHVVIREVLPKDVMFKSDSAYLYTPANSDGTQQANTLPKSGIATGTLKPGESASIQFQVSMPASNKLACGKTTLTNAMTAETRGGKVFTTSNRITVDNQCSAPTPTTSTPTPTTTTPVTTTTSSSSTDATAVTAEASTPTTSTTASSESASAARDDDDTEGTKTLVETGFGQIFSIFAIASVAGVIVYRLVLHKRASL